MGGFVPNIAVIVADERVRRQVETYLNEGGDDDVRYASFKSSKEFETLYFRPREEEKPEDKDKPKPEGEKSPEPEPGPIDLRLFSNLNVIIFSIDALTEKVPAWSLAILRRLKERSYWPENNRTRLIFVKYEDSPIPELDFFIPEIEDMIYAPLDRLLFLQKLEVILALPKKVKGKYLYVQTINREIELSKVCKLERVSDVGIAVRNPLPLSAGIRAKFYFTLSGQKDLIRLFAKAIRSIPHPEVSNQYLCYFSFFGIGRKETSLIRQWLGKVPFFKLLVVEDRAKFKVDPYDLMRLEAAGPVRSIVLLDPAEDQATAITTQIRSELFHSNVTTESSYAYFVHKYILHRDKFPVSNVIPKPTRQDDIPGGLLQLKIHYEKRLLKWMNFAPQENDKIFGHPMNAWC